MTGSNQHRALFKQHINNAGVNSYSPNACAHSQCSFFDLHCIFTRQTHIYRSYSTPFTPPHALLPTRSSTPTKVSQFQTQLAMSTAHLPIQAELTQQVWGAVHNPLPVSADQQVWSSEKPTDIRKTLLAPATDDDFGDEEFGEFETADSPPPSPLPRGYLRSSQNIDHFYEPRDMEEDDDDDAATGGLSWYETSARSGYSPLTKAEASATSSPQTRHGNATQRMWALGKQTFAKLGAAKKTQEVTALWKAGFVNKEHEELKKVVMSARKVPMVVETGFVATRDPLPALVNYMVEEEEPRTVKVKHMPPSWLEEEREAWST
ncbi:hypothetical protein BU23DRAFT_337527 [Bimuria novae-zelandiae CBS 107.79]|uniref:Uncharacterized protein n=1 Tax=Bimuria novae-zelandiae CBS 107.79 TaxID=1447943 RepID=A0A6A5UM34_9PLEO|nr:hypothetical protein BU23DRAFT_337527 [Bimuria novae-zelandiae CBS 107.79]